MVGMTVSWHLPLLLLLFLLVLLHDAETFIVGGCIGPKSVLERHLSEKHRAELRKLVHANFDGANAKEVLNQVNEYVFDHVSDNQWLSILPELREYQSQDHECSIYAQLLPKDIYVKLLTSVFRASEMGASKFDVKRLVEDYVERLAKAGVLVDVNSIDEPELPLVALPPHLVSSQGYRNSQTSYHKFTKPGGPSGGRVGNGYRPRPNPAMSKYPTLIGYPQSGFERAGSTRRPEDDYDYNVRPPQFPIARPSTVELGEYVDRTGPTPRRQRVGPRRPRPHRVICDADCISGASASASAAAASSAKATARV